MTFSAATYANRRQSFPVLEGRITALEETVAAVKTQSGDGLAFVGAELRVDIDSLPQAVGA